MNNFILITPEELKLKRPDYERPLEELQAIAKRPARKCMQPFCDELEWKFAETGLCFSHTTGESDASQDYELVVKSNKKEN